MKAENAAARGLPNIRSVRRYTIKGCDMIRAPGKMTSETGRLRPVTEDMMEATIDIIGKGKKYLLVGHAG
jgi:hypothetical protein